MQHKWTSLLNFRPWLCILLMGATIPTVTVAPEVEVVSVSPQFTVQSVSPPQEKTGTLHILTYNVWGLPGRLSQDRPARFERLGATLVPYDVVTLQETFADDIQILKKNSAFAYHLRHNNANMLRTGSGLYILSKYPIVKSTYKPFGACAVADCLSQKGVLWSRILHPTLGLVDIYTTHYQAQALPESARIRLAEDNQVMQAFVQQNQLLYPTILTGDYNFLPNSPEYLDLMKRLPLIDVFCTLNPYDPGFTSDGVKNPYVGDKTQERLDYIFVYKHERYQVELLESAITHHQRIDQYVLSDHFGVRAKLRFRLLK